MAKLARLPIVDRAADVVRSRAPRLRTRYYAFLSYSHRDRELADWLHSELERFRVPSSLAGKLTANGVVPKRLAPVFRDQQDLSAGDDLAEEIKAALAGSQFLIVLCSPTAATSRWTNQEIESFKRTRPEGCVLAAVVAGEPFASDMPGRETEECFPPALRYKYDRRGHQTAKRAEPLAADFRESGEGQRMAFLKLVAGMLGVGLDELVQRDTTRRHRRMAWLAAGSLAGMAVTSTLAVTAFQARDAAREQRREAEGLVAFMLGDLKDKLEPIGRLDALDGVGSRVLAYYSKQDSASLSDAALLQRARALSLTAQVAYLRGHLENATRLYKEALAGTAEAVRRSPDDTERIFEHAQNVFWVGEIARYQGRSDEAFAAYREYKSLGDRLVSLEPDNLKWRMESLYGRENVGIALYNRRQYAQATAEFAGAQGPMESLAALDPGNRTYQKELSTLLAWLADARRASGDLDGAIVARRRQIALLERALSRDPRNVDLLAPLVPAHQGLGILLEAKGASDAAIGELQLAVDRAQHLTPIEPTNSYWRTIAASASLQLALSSFDARRLEVARTATKEGCEAIARAADPNPSRTRAQTECLAMRTRIAVSDGQKRDAQILAEQVLTSARAEHGSDPITDSFRIASAYRLLGNVLKENGNSEGAVSAWTAGLAQLPKGQVERPSETEERMLLLLLLGRNAEAQHLSDKLKAIGYRTSEPR